MLSVENKKIVEIQGSSYSLLIFSSNRKSFVVLTSVVLFNGPFSLTDPSLKVIITFYLDAVF